MPPRRLASRHARMVFALTVMILMLAGILAAIAPLVGEKLGAKRFTVEVYAPQNFAEQAYRIAELLSESINADYRLKLLNTNNASVIVGVVVYEHNEPLLVTFIDALASNEQVKTLGMELRSELNTLHSFLRSNETMLYIGYNEFYILPRNATIITSFIEKVVTGK